MLCLLRAAHSHRQSEAIEQAARRLLRPPPRTKPSHTSRRTACAVAATMSARHGAAGMPGVRGQRCGSGGAGGGCGCETRPARVESSSQGRHRGANLHSARRLRDQILDRLQMVVVRVQVAAKVVECAGQLRQYVSDENAVSGGKCGRLRTGALERRGARGRTRRRRGA